MSEYVEAFDEIVSNLVAQYLSLSQKIGGDVQKHVGYSSGAECSVFWVSPCSSADEDNFTSKKF